MQWYELTKRQNWDIFLGNRVTGNSIDFWFAEFWPKDWPQFWPECQIKKVMCTNCSNNYTILWARNIGPRFLKSIIFHLGTIKGYFSLCTSFRRLPRKRRERNTLCELFVAAWFIGAELKQLCGFGLESQMISGSHENTHTLTDIRNPLTDLIDHSWVTPIWTQLFPIIGFTHLYSIPGSQPGPPARHIGKGLIQRIGK